MKNLLKHIARNIVRGVAFAAVALAGQGQAMAQLADEEVHSSRYYYNRANNYQEAQAWNASKREIDDGLKHYPDDPDLRYLNGRYYYYGEGDMQAARYNLIKAIQESDHHYGARRLLVDVEDSTKHYSSAICYINELLEYQPYDRDLWRRKISFYKRLGHDVEADAALQRLARIYPNDSIVRRELQNRNRENWTERLKQITISERANELETWISNDENNRDYYLELIDIYIKLGEPERALGVANRALYRLGPDSQIANKAALIMAEHGLYPRAMSYLRENRGSNDVYRKLMAELAYDSRMRDSYEINSKYFEQSGDRETLAYLLNTALTRGYYDDAHRWIRESYRRGGDTVTLLLKEYALEKRFGDEKATRRVLERLYAANPKDKNVNEGVKEEYAAMMLELANREIEHEQWGDASNSLRRALEIIEPENEMWAPVVARQIMMLGRTNRLDEARSLCKYAMAMKPEEAARFGSAYEEIAAARLKILMEEERYDEALREAEALLEILPTSEPGLRCAINMTQTLKRSKAFYEYAERGYVSYPETPYFIVKQAVALGEQKRYAEAVSLLRPTTDEDDYYVNPQLVNAMSGVTEEWALLLIRDNMPDIALDRLDQALVYDPDNKELLYLKGLAYEKMKRYDLAYEYQHRYSNPTNAEQLEWYQHMRYMRFRSFRNRVDASYTSAWYDTRQDDLISTGHLYSIANISYSRLTEKNTYTGQISYKGVDGVHSSDVNQSGGIGLEFMAQWEHTFNHRWSGMINASWSTKFFNKIGANISASYSADNGWTPSLRLGYRRTPPTYIYLNTSDGSQSEYKKYNMFLITPAIAKAWERITTSLSADLVLMRRGLFYNVGWKGKLFINEDNISSVGLMVGFGSFPELSFFEQNAIQSISHTNGMVGADFQYLLTNNFCIGLVGTWNTCYNPFRREDGTVAEAFRNIYSLALQLHVAF